MTMTPMLRGSEPLQAGMYFASRYCRVHNGSRQAWWRKTRGLVLLMNTFFIITRLAFKKFNPQKRRLHCAVSP